MVQSVILRSRSTLYLPAAAKKPAGSSCHDYPRLKYCTARSCLCAAAREENVPRFFRLPLFASFLRE